MADRKRQILQCLAAELEARPRARITTARLAQAVGVTEAALYRHFPGKASMFEALLAFAETSVFSRVNRLLADEPDPVRRCEKLLELVLVFSERNPGISRVLLGDPLIGEADELGVRATQFFSRFETQLKQVLREGGGHSPQLRQQAPALANLLSAFLQGRMLQFVATGFKRKPTEDWPVQSRAIRNLLGGGFENP